VFFPFLKFRMEHSATLAWCERSLVENSFDSARISSRYFRSATGVGKSHAPAPAARRRKQDVRVRVERILQNQCPTPLAEKESKPA